MRRAFERWTPELGVAALVSTLLPVADGAGDYVRHLAYWKGLHALSPFRLVAPKGLLAYHVLGQQLVRNARGDGLEWRGHHGSAVPWFLAAAPRGFGFSNHPCHLESS